MQAWLTHTVKDVVRHVVGDADDEGVIAVEGDEENAEEKRDVNEGELRREVVVENSGGNLRARWRRESPIDGKRLDGVRSVCRFCETRFRAHLLFDPDARGIEGKENDTGHDEARKRDEDGQNSCRLRMVGASSIRTWAPNTRSEQNVIYSPISLTYLMPRFNVPDAKKMSPLKVYASLEDKSLCSRTLLDT